MKWRDRAQRVLFAALDAELGSYCDVAWGPPTVPIEAVGREVIVRLRWVADLVASRSLATEQVLVAPGSVTYEHDAAPGAVMRVRCGGPMAPQTAMVEATSNTEADLDALAAEAALWLDVSAARAPGTLTLSALMPLALTGLTELGLARTATVTQAPVLASSVRYLAHVAVDVWSVSQAHDARDVLGLVERVIGSPGVAAESFLRGLSINAVGEARVDLSAYLSGGQWETRATSTAILAHVETRAVATDTITSATIEPE